MNPKISVCMHTASRDNFLKGIGVNSALDMYIYFMNKQSFKDFEFILIDGHYEENRDEFSKIKTDFIFKHVPIHDDHRYWYDMGVVHISSIKNTGILYADGELLVTVDDAEIFPSNILEGYWNYYKNKGLYLCAAHKRVKVSANLLDIDGFNLNGEIYVNDSRWREDCSIVVPMPSTWTYAGTSYSLEDALKLNGFNEKMDGCKSLEDVEFGMRLEVLGRTFAYDTSLFIVIPDHSNSSHHYDKTSLEDYGVEEIKNVVCKENYGFCLMAITNKVFEANKRPLSFDELVIINDATKKFQKFSLDLHNKDTKIWLDTPNFNLTEQREELRSSDLWKW